jgi:hypothetical protein
MAPKTNATKLSDSEIERLNQCVLDAQNQIHSAQGSLNEINSLLNTRRTVNAAAPNPASSNSTPEVTSTVEGDEIKSGAAKIPNTTNQAKTIDTKKIVRVSKFSTSAITDEQAAFLRTLLGNTKKTKAASHFLKPVNHVALGLNTYTDEIEHPMDLGTMTTKLHGNEYVSVQILVDDLQLIVDNAKKFNGPTHNITHAAYAMLAYAHEKLEKLPPSEGMALKPQGRKRKGSV